MSTTLYLSLCSSNGLFRAAVNFLMHDLGLKQNQMSVYEQAKAMQDQIAKGQAMEAFEKYYHDDVKVIEMPTHEVREGKDAQRKAIQEWFGMVEEIHGEGCDAITANEEQATTMVECWTDMTMKGVGRMKMQEVAVQKWKDGQIIEEKFYYHNPEAGASEGEEE